MEGSRGHRGTHREPAIVNLAAGDVAEAVAKLVATSKGPRPDRVVVGQAFGSDAVNAAVAPIQRQVVEGLGLGSLTAVKA